MGRKKAHTPEEIVAKLRQVEVLVGQGKTVADAVRAYLDSKRSVIATFKCLGAPASLVALIYLTQIALIATVGILIGLVI